MPVEYSKFHIKVKKGSFLNLSNRVVIEDTISVRKGDLSALRLGNGLDDTRLCVKHYKDGGSRVELDYVPMSIFGVLGDGILKLKNKALKFYGMESESNINFPSEKEIKLEVPTTVGSIRAKIKRIS